MTDTRQAKAGRGSRIAIGVLIAVVCLFCFLSDVGALGGVGRMVYGFLVGFFGLASYAYSLMGLILGVAIAFGVKRRQRILRSLYFFGLLLIGIFALHIYTSSGHIVGANYGDYLLACYRGTNTAGGMLFGILAYPLMKVITGVGALSVTCAAFLIMAGLGLLPTIRRNTVYKVVSPEDRRKEKSKRDSQESQKVKRQRGDKVVANRDPAITDFAHIDGGARLYVVDVDGEPEKVRRGKGAQGYRPLGGFNMLYPNQNGGIEDEQRFAPPTQPYSAPAPVQATYPPVSPAVESAREILFGSGPSDENLARYQASLNSGVAPMTDVGSMYRSPQERKQEMLDKFGGADDAKADYINRHRAGNDPEQSADDGSVDFETIKNQSLQQWRSAPMPVFETEADAVPPAGEVLMAQPSDGDGKKELAKPTRVMPKPEDLGAAQRQGGDPSNSVNVGMLGAINQARSGDQQPAQVPPKQDADAEAYSTPQSPKQGAELAHGAGSQDGYTPIRKPGLDSVRYVPSATTKIPRAFAGNGIQQAPQQPYEEAQQTEQGASPQGREPLSSSGIYPQPPAAESLPVGGYKSSGDISYHPLKKVDPLSSVPPLEPDAELPQVPSEPLPVPREVTGGKMSGAAIQSATDIAHLNGKDKEQAEMQARLENLRKSKELAQPLVGGGKPAISKPQKPSAPVVHQPTLEQVIKQAEAPSPKPKRPYIAPPLSLLDPPREKVAQDDDIDEKGERLLATLRNFKIGGVLEKVDVGPTFTMYSVKVNLKEGTSVSVVSKYYKDIAMQMEVESVRLQAPIPGKNAIGVEIPNKNRRTVNLSEILMSKEFNESTDPATFAIGVDLYGTSHIGKIMKLPHLLVAGQTGAGKSCCVNSLIVSLLYKASPDDVRFIMVDPKRVELSVYSGIPHMLMDEIICDTDKAIRAISWAEQEMDRRTRYFQETGYRNIEEYNSDLKNSGLEKMPLIVIIIDEFADLITTGKKPVETSIGRIASLARAVGIHLVLATQRPSVDVIPGTIRNNIPSRIAFRVSDGGSSRTILDTVGAEDLLGMGDMLYMEYGKPDVQRIQGAFISNAEVKRVVEFVKANNDCSFNMQAKDEIFNGKPEKKPDAPAPKERKATRNSPDLLDALALGIELRETDGNSFSTSYIQRRLGFGYQKAARIVDTIKEMDYIAPSDRDPKKFVVTMTREEFEEFKAAVEAENDDGGDQ